MPRRHQLRRDTPLPAGVVRVDRATIWGNPFRADKVMPAVYEVGAVSAAQAFKFWLDGHPALADIEPVRRAGILASIGRLHGKDIACWCSADAECHADVLLARAAAAAPTIGDALGRPDGVPTVALSVRQPWAWGLIFGGKDIENRSEAAVRHGMRAQVGNRIAIHASKGMTRNEYESARDFMSRIGVVCPPAPNLDRGGIIGSMLVASVVDAHPSPWFFGPRGLVMRDPEAIAFIGASGELGMFQWCPNFAQADAPAKWMLPKLVAVAKEDPVALLQRGFEFT